MALNQNFEVKVISDCFVKPKYNVEESKTPHYLLGNDLKWLSIRYIHCGFLFNKPKTSDFDMKSFVEKMKDSFSHTLVYYYPLAGRFTSVKNEDEHAYSVHVDCNKGPGARFIHSSCERATVCDIFYHLPAMAFLFDLGETGGINYDGHTRALVSLQVTELEDGIVIGVTMNHSIADGTSFMNFVHSLSEIFRSTDDDKMNTTITHIPIFTPLLLDGCNLIQKLPYIEPEEFVSRIDNDPGLSERIFRFSSLSIANLKERANSEQPGNGPRKISSFQALAALMWISINRARKLPAQAMTICMIPVDCRPRFNPPLSSNHFGNIGRSLVVAKNVGDLLDNGFGPASMMLHQHIAGYDHHVATRYLKETMENPQVVRLDGNKNDENMNLVNFSWASKFDMYGVDFGLGKVVACPSGDNDKRDGMVIVKVEEVSI